MGNKHVPMRTCRGCGQKRPKAELLRLSWQHDRVVIDIDGTLSGRGMYCCHDKQCRYRLEKNKKGLKRAFRLDG